MVTLTTALLGVRAKGAFGPQNREGIQPKALGALRSERFLVRTPQLLVGGCGDERLDEAGQRLPLPPVFGGWLSAVLSDALTTRLWYRPGMTVQEHARIMADALGRIAPRAVMCVHTDTHAVRSHAPECGCAAIAKAPAVLGLLIEYGDLIDSRYRQRIITNARQLLGAGYFQPGTAAMVDSLTSHRRIRKEVLAGAHDGLAVVRNRREGYVYDRPAFYAWCKQNGFALPFFEYAEWSMRATADLLTPSREAANFFFAAGDAFNSVVPYAICNPRMPYIVVE